MKICWDNLEGFHLSKRGNLRNKNHTYVEKQCRRCGDDYLTTENLSDYCSNSCAQKNKFFSMELRSKLSKIRKNKRMGTDNPGWKGGVIENDIAPYATYAEQLNYAEEVQSYTNDYGTVVIMARCSKCAEWFIPSRNSVRSRIKSLNGKMAGENRFYCSQGCKDNCEIFKKKAELYLDLTQKKDFYIQEELSVWSQEVLKRANYKCEICGKPAEHAHHIEPKKLAPGLALDPENGLALCKKCHYKYGHQNECSTGKLATIICSK